MQIIGDFQTSVDRALSEIDANWREFKGLIVCGTHAPENVDAQLLAIQEARERGLPFLGICHGHQLAAVEYARNVIGYKNADSEEWGGGDHIVVKLPQLKVGLHDEETYWNNYEVLPGFIDLWKKPDSFFTCQFHPEYQSSKDKPHPLLVQFLNHAKMAM